MTPGLISGNAVNDKKWMKVVRLVIGIASIGVCMSLAGLVSKVGLESDYILMILKNLMPSILMGLALFYVVDLISI